MGEDRMRQLAEKFEMPVLATLRESGVPYVLPEILLRLLARIEALEKQVAAPAPEA